MHTNNPCALCDNYGYYSHHYPHLEDFFDPLQVLHELDATRSDSTSPLLVGSTLIVMLEHEVSQPIIVIPPLDFDMMDSFAHILYLSSSMGSIYYNLLTFTFVILLNLF